MKITYDPSVDIVRILFNNQAIMESDEEKTGMIIDYDASGNIVGMEILHASKHMENLESIDYTIVNS